MRSPTLAPAAPALASAAADDHVRVRDTVRPWHAVSGEGPTTVFQMYLVVTTDWACPQQGDPDLWPRRDKVIQTCGLRQGDLDLWLAPQ